MNPHSDTGDEGRPDEDEDGSAASWLGESVSARTEVSVAGPDARVYAVEVRAGEGGREGTKTAGSERERAPEVGSRPRVTVSISGVSQNSGRPHQAVVLTHVDLDLSNNGRGGAGRASVVRWDGEGRASTYARFLGLGRWLERRSGGWLAKENKWITASVRYSKGVRVRKDGRCVEMGLTAFFCFFFGGGCSPASSTASGLMRTRLRLDRGGMIEVR